MSYFVFQLFVVSIIQPKQIAAMDNQITAYVPKLHLPPDERRIWRRALYQIADPVQTGGRLATFV